MSHTSTQTSSQEVSEHSSSKRRRLNRDDALPWMPGFESRYEGGAPIEDVVKCICGFACPDELETRQMVQCDHCLNWQHTECLALQEEDLEADYYFCHLCLPDRHAKSITEHSRKKLQVVPVKPKAFAAATEYVKSSRRIETHRQQAYSTRASLSRRAEQLRKRLIRKEEELEKDIEMIRGCLRLKSTNSNRKPALLPTGSKALYSLPVNPASRSPRQRNAMISHKHVSIIDQLCDATGLHRARLNTMLEVAEEALCLLDTSVRYHDASVEACCRARNGNRHNALEYIATIFPRECSMTQDLSEWLLCAASHQAIPQQPKQEPSSPRRNQLPFKVVKLIAPARKTINPEATPIPIPT